MKDRLKLPWYRKVELGLVALATACAGAGGPVQLNEEPQPPAGTGETGPRAGVVTPEAGRWDLTEIYPGVEVAVSPLAGESWEIPDSDMALGVAIHEVDGKANADLVACKGECVLYDLDSVRQEAVQTGEGWAQRWRLPALESDAVTIDPSRNLVVVLKGNKYGVTLPFEVKEVAVERNGQRVGQATPDAPASLRLGEALARLGTDLGVIPEVAEAAGPTPAATASAAAPDSSTEACAAMPQEEVDPLVLTLRGTDGSGRAWELGCHKGLWVRRDGATRVITQVIGEGGEWTPTLAPELSVDGGLITLGIMKDLTQRETQPWVKMEVNPNTGSDWQERLQEYWWRLSYQNHIQNYPPDANVPWDEGLEKLKNGEWLIKIWVADAAESTVRDRGRDELKVLEYPPVNGVVISAAHEVKGLTASPIRAAYATLDENGRLVIVYNMRVVDLSESYAVDLSDEASLGYTYMTNGIVWWTQVVTQPLAVIEKIDGYYGGVFSNYPPGEILEWRNSMLEFGVDESNLDNSQPMVLVYTNQ